MVKPCAFSEPIVWPICWMMTGAKPSVGSSSNKSRAPVRRMRPIASICCSPPESLMPWLLSRSRKFGNSVKMRSRSSPPGRTCGGSNRFSRTSRLEKMPRSSGQNAMPARAITFDGSVVSSRPSKRTEPVRASTMPMIAFSVVVLPTPFLPSSVTTSPSCTSKVTPCSTWDSPYHASRFATARSGRASGMASSEIGFAHGRILRHSLVVALGEHVAAGQHGDAVAQIGDHRKIMLDHQHRALVGQRLDQSADAGDVVVTHAGHGLVEQEHRRIKRERGGDLEHALAAVWQFDRECVRIRRQADVVHDRHGAVVEAMQHAFGAPEIERAAADPLQRDADILQHGEMGKHRRDLKRAHEPEPRHFGWPQRGDVAAVEGDAAPRRDQEFAEQIEAGGLAGAVRADQRVNGPARDAQIDRADRDKAGEFLGQILGFEDDVATHKRNPHAGSIVDAIRQAVKRNSALATIFPAYAFGAGT